MKTDTVSFFVEAVRQSGLLQPAQMEHLTRAAAEATDPKVLAKDLIQRGWLTTYQAQLLLKGRGNELFLGSYVLLDRIGEGGMGQVFRARHQRMGRDVALKVIRKVKLSNPEAIRRFQREIQAAASLSHPNIVMAYDADQVGDMHFFAMEFVDGVDLARLVRDRGPLPWAQACDYVRQAALGLQHAHERGMVHRDIKPSNLLLTLPRLPGDGTKSSRSFGGAPPNTVKLLDMGLARLEETASGEVPSMITQEGLVLGTPDFLAPEQAKNASKVDIRADLYALGCTLYYLLTAQVPFPGGTPTEKLLKHYMDPPPDPRQWRPDVPPGVVAIVQRLMAKKPEDRYQTPDELAHALVPFCAPPASGTRLTPPSSGVLPAPAPVVVAPGLPAPPPAAFAPHQPADPPTDSHFRVSLPTEEKLAASRGRGRGRSGPGAAVWIAVAFVLFVTVAAAGGGAAFLLLRGPDKPKEPTLTTLTNSAGIQLVLLPGGRFKMGTPTTEEGRQPNELLHDVQVSPFGIGVHEVTQAQFAKLMDGKNPSQFAAERGGGPDHPVENVPWADAVEFCKRLSDLPEEKSAGRVYRLPTEAEWEYACRAGTQTRFAGGQTLSSEQANFDGVAEAPGLDPRGGQLRNHTTPVGSFAANKWGLYDTEGNAAEWCADWFSQNYYGSLAGNREPAKDPQGPRQPTGARVLRGGAWNDKADHCRCGYRGWLTPEKPNSTAGFRVAMSTAK